MPLHLYKGNILGLYTEKRGFPDGSVVKNPPANAEDARKAGSIPGSGRSPGEGNGNPLQYSCLENSMDRETWWATVHVVAETDTATVHVVAETDTAEQLSTHIKKQRRQHIYST